MTVLYENIQAVIKQRGLKSIRRLEASAGIPSGTIKRWKDSLPATANALIKLSSYLGCSIDQLMIESSHEPLAGEPVNRIHRELNCHTFSEEEAALLIDVIQAVARSQKRRSNP